METSIPLTRLGTTDFVDSSCAAARDTLVAKASTTRHGPERRARHEDTRLHPWWLLRSNANFCFEVVVEMGLDAVQRLLISLQAVDHDGAFQRRNNQRGELLGVDTGADFLQFD